MHYVRVGDATLHVEIEGPADRPKVVFVNSLGSDLRIWDDVVVALAHAKIGALRYDLRGHGLSDLGSPPRLIDDHVSGLAAVMGLVGMARSTICEGVDEPDRIIGTDIVALIALAVGLVHSESD
jgi:3-oxoadipate enol-lactonase